MAGVREQQREATRTRIADAGLRLFRERGYDATTLDDVAAAAGISRRTFFHHFASKEEVVLAWHGAGALSTALGPAMREQSPEQPPLDAAARCLVELASRYETAESRAMDALLRSSGTLEARKAAAEVRMERDLADAMGALWPDPTRVAELRLAATVAVAVLRVALEAWRRDDAGIRLATHLRRTFDALPGVVAGR